MKKNAPKDKPLQLRQFFDQYRLQLAIALFASVVLFAVVITLTLGQSPQPTRTTLTPTPKETLPPVVTATNNVKYHTGAYITTDTRAVVFHDFTTNLPITSNVYSALPPDNTYTLGNWSPNGRYLPILQTPTCQTNCSPVSLLLYDAENDSITVATREVAKSASWTLPSAFQALQWIDNSMLTLEVSSDNKQATYYDIKKSLTGKLNIKESQHGFYRSSNVSYNLDAANKPTDIRILGTSIKTTTIPIGTINSNLLVSFDANAETIIYTSLATKTTLYSAVIPHDQWRTTSIQQVIPTNKTIIKQVAVNNPLSERYLTYDPRGMNTFITLFDQTVAVQNTQLSQRMSNGQTSDFVLSPNGEMLLVVNDANKTISMVSLDTNKTTVPFCQNCTSISIPQVWSVYRTVEPL